MMPATQTETTWLSAAVPIGPAVACHRHSVCPLPRSPLSPPVSLRRDDNEGTYRTPESLCIFQPIPTPVNRKIDNSNDSLCNPTAQTPKDSLANPDLRLAREPHNEKDVGDNVQTQTHS